jgi:hypothetical protein
MSESNVSTLNVKASSSWKSEVSIGKKKGLCQKEKTKIKQQQINKNTLFAITFT